MKLSIVTTLYRSAEYIDEFYGRITATAAEVVGDDYEIIFVDDGSPDASLARVVALHEIDGRVKVVQLSRNFGHHKAIMTGIGFATGDHVFVVDVDLEEKPELLQEFWQTMETEGCDLVYGVQDSRKGTWFEKISSRYFYRIFNYMSGVEIPRNSLIVKLMTRSYRDALIAHKDRSIFLAGLCVLTGFEQRPVMCDKTNKGETTYDLKRKISQAIDSITSFSSQPLYMISGLGFVMAFVSMLYIAYIVMNKLFFAAPVDGWSSIIVSIYFIGGLILFSIGLIGIYISRIFNEVKDRPYTIVQGTWGDL